MKGTWVSWPALTVNNKTSSSDSECRSRRSRKHLPVTPFARRGLSVWLSMQWPVAEVTCGVNLYISGYAALFMNVPLVSCDADSVGRSGGGGHRIPVGRSRRPREHSARDDARALRANRERPRVGKVRPALRSMATVCGTSSVLL